MASSNAFKAYWRSEIPQNWKFGFEVLIILWNESENTASASRYTAFWDKKNMKKETIGYIIFYAIYYENI